MTAEKKIKIQAKKALTGNWPGAVGAVLLALCIMLFISIPADVVIISLELLLSKIAETFAGVKLLVDNFQIIYTLLVPVGVILPLFLISPIFTGVLKYFYSLAKNSDADFSEVFAYCGKKYFRALSLNFSLLLRCFLRIYLPLLPYIGIRNTMNLLTYNKESLAFWEIMWYAVSYALLFIGIIVAVRLCTGHFLSFFVFFEDETLSNKELVVFSKDSMKSFKNSMLRLALSMSPWIIICITVIPAIFVLPYILTSISISAKWIIALKFNNKED